MSAPQTDGHTTPVAMPADSQPGSRWRRFSLRVLLIAITVAACSCGWVVSQMNRRDALLESLRSRSAFAAFHSGKSALPRVAWLTPAAWFRSVESIFFPLGMLDSQEQDELRRLFPEAELVEFIPSINSMPERNLPLSKSEEAAVNDGRSRKGHPKQASPPRTTTRARHR